MLRASGKRVVLAATTGAAASRLSKHAYTVHALFNLPCRNGTLSPMPMFSDKHKILNGVDVIIIDEVSMLSYLIFNLLALRMATLTGVLKPDPFADVHVILVGDLSQVRLW